MNVALVIGHKFISGGAISHTGQSEFEYNADLVESVARNLRGSNKRVLVFFRDSYKKLPDEINRKNPDVIVSFHCNAFDKKATGSEVLYYHSSTAGQQLASKLQNAIHGCLKLSDRGIKPKHEEDLGGYLLKNTAAPCVILEPFFIDNDSDFSAGVELKQNLALAISNVIKDLT